MESQFIELISDMELEKLREAVRLSKELAELQNLFELKKDLDFCNEKFLEHIHKNGKYCFKKHEVNFSNDIYEYFCNLLIAIENKDLILKNAKV